MDAIASAPTAVLVALLFAAMIAANEIGFRVGRRHHRHEQELSRTVSNTLKASVLGLVAFLLGFTFSITASRHDQRRRVVLDEANAIGTCYLRAGLLAEADRDRIRNILRRYTEARLIYFTDGLDPDVLARSTAEMNRLLDEFWKQIEAATRATPSVVHTSHIVPAANDLIDLSSTRSWAARSHLPPPVLALLMVSIVVACLLMGHSSGQSGGRHTGLWMALNILFVLVLFVVIDFDRPRRGLVQVDHTPLVDLQASFGPN